MNVLVPAGHTDFLGRKDYAPHDFIGVVTMAPELIVALGANLLSIISLVLMTWQIREVRKELKITASQGIYGVWIELDQFFVEHPALRPYFYEPGVDLAPDATEELRCQVDATAEMMVDAFVNFWHQKQCFESGEERAYCGFIRERYQKQPCLRRFVDQNEHWYPRDFSTYLTSASQTRSRLLPRLSPVPKRAMGGIAGAAAGPGADRVGSGA